jgi:hydrogenase-4 membrane subunit HyfE
MTRPWLSLGRFLYGLFVLAFGSRIASRLSGHKPDAELRGFVALLGVRHLAQALLLLRVPQLTALRIGASIDAIHSASMVGFFARVSRHWRWAAAADALPAAGWSWLQLHLLRRRERP